jgi:hypothetical protein
MMPFIMSRPIFSTLSIVRVLSLRTPKAKGEHMFLKEDFLALPVWIELDNVELDLEPFRDKLEEIEKKGDIVFEKYLEAQRAKPESSKKRRK